MIKFKNILTNNIFILPEDKAIEIIKQEPEFYQVLSGLNDNSVLDFLTPKPSVNNPKDIYNLVVVGDVIEKNIEDKPKTQEAVKPKAKKKAIKKSKVNKKEKLL